MRNARFELKHARRVAARDERVRVAVVERDLVHVEERALPVGPDVHQALRDIDDREGLQTQEIEFDEAGRFDVVLVVLRDDRFAAREARNVRVERAFADDDAGRVHAGVPGEALELPRLIEEFLHLRIGLRTFAELRLDLERLVDRAHLALSLFGDQARDALSVGRKNMPMVRATSLMMLRAFQVLERRDLSDAGFPVFFSDVLNDLVTPRHAKIDVEVRLCSRLLRIQEALEQQVVRNGIDRRDIEGIGDDRTGAELEVRARARRGSGAIWPRE